MAALVCGCKTGFFVFITVCHLSSLTVLLACISDEAACESVSHLWLSLEGCIYTIRYVFLFFFFFSANWVRFTIGAMLVAYLT